MNLLPSLVYAAALIMVIAAAVLASRWVGARLQAAQWRLAREEWQEIRASQVSGAPGWPDDQTGTRYFFDTDYVPYDPDADAAVYIENMTSGVRDYIASLSRRACDQSAGAAA